MNNPIRKSAGPFCAAWLKICALYVALEFVLRIVLACSCGAEALGHPSLLQWCGVFVLGAVADALVATVLCAPLWLYALSTGAGRFAGRMRLWWSLLAVAAAVTVSWGWPQLREFNAGLHRVLSGVMWYWAATYLLMVWRPALRIRWQRAWLAAVLFIYVFILLFNIFGEWQFWDEFGVRYNFIAVDYLVYTTEVVGNIWQSYPMGRIIAAVVVLAAGTEWLLLRREIKAMPATAVTPAEGALYPAAAIVSALLLPVVEGVDLSGNTYVNGIARSGPYCFYDAFFKNTLDYNDFYPTLPPDKVDAILSADRRTPAAPDTVPASLPNIVIITMESMSAEYMERYGCTEHLTPALDSLAACSIAFDRLMAAGNRTVRGLEALTLMRPPAPGESIIKRNSTEHYPCVADILAPLGYRMAFVYGGDAYFDNMGPHFSSMGYEIVDSHAFSPAEVTMRTVWGICDEDVYTHLCAILDTLTAPADHAPVLAHILTTSNHRPYLYPEGRISIPPSAHSRSGGVMYADWALGQFMRRAATRPWFANTVFLIVADHCASSAGSTELPPARYHIPALIHAPGRLSAHAVSTLASQIDLMPTLLSLIGIAAHTPYGRNIFSPDYQPRAFLATYQDLGYMAHDTLTVLSPVRRIRRYQVHPDSLTLRPISTPATPEDAAAAIAPYQKSATE